MKQAIEQALAPLIGEPLWAVGRAASLVWFQFGERHAVADRQGGQREVGAPSPSRLSVGLDEELG